MGSRLLSIENLTFGWQNKPLFDNVSCRLQKNQIVQLTGENGAGKTTLLQLISGMIPHFNRGEILQGNIFINGQSILHESPKHFFPTIAFIPSINLDFFLFAETLVQEILLIRSILKIERDLAEKRLTEFSDFFPDVVGIVDMRFKDMQIQQKVLALTFIFYIQNARLFLFDEVLSLFSRSVNHQWFSFFEYLSSNGCAVIFVNHQLRIEKYSQWLIKNRNLLSS